MRAALLLPVLLVTACAQSYTSYVGPLDAGYAPRIAGDMAGFARQRVKDVGPLCVDQPADDQTIAPLLLADLEDLGFTAVKSGCKHHLRYGASTLAGDVMIRVSVDHADGARLYRDNAKAGLSPLGPFSVTEATEQ